MPPPSAHQHFGVTGATASRGRKTKRLARRRPKKMVHVHSASRRNDDEFSVYNAHPTLKARLQKNNETSPTSGDPKSHLNSPAGHAEATSTVNPASHVRLILDLSKAKRSDNPTRPHTARAAAAAAARRNPQSIARRPGTSHENRDYSYNSGVSHILGGMSNDVSFRSRYIHDSTALELAVGLRQPKDYAVRRRPAGKSSKSPIADRVDSRASRTNPSNSAWLPPTTAHTRQDSTASVVGIPPIVAPTWSQIQVSEHQQRIARLACQNLISFQDASAKLLPIVSAVRMSDTRILCHLFVRVYLSRRCNPCKLCVIGPGRLRLRSSSPHL